MGSNTSQNAIFFSKVTANRAFVYGIIFEKEMMIMQKYGNLMIIIGFVVMTSSTVINIQYMYIVQICLLLFFSIIFFIGGHLSQEFLIKFKYLLLYSIVFYFFVLRNRDGGYYGVDSENLFFSDSITLIESFFLGFVMLRIDRFYYINKKLEDIKETF